MDIVSTVKEDMLILDFIGQLDTGTAPKAEVEVNKHLEGNQKIIFNLAKTAFVSSAGLRVFLGTAKKLKAAGGLFRAVSLKISIRFFEFPSIFKKS